MNVIRVYKWDDCWWFDDVEKGIVKEELVGGSPEFIENFIIEAKNIFEFNLVFSSDELEGYDFKLTFVRFEEAGYIYKWCGNEMWLCSVLNQYYDLAPEKIYLKNV
jgi:hypothetical protein